MAMGLFVTIAPEVWSAIKFLKNKQDKEDLFHKMRKAADENRDRPFDYMAQRPIE